MAIQATFWGVRGSHPTCGPHVNQVGGHTSCVSVQESEETILIFDAGTGLIPLGQFLSQQPVTEINLFITHFHIDHLLGLMFFAPLWNPQIKINFFAPYTTEGTTFKDILTEKLFCPPLFPIHFDQTPSKWTFHNFRPQEIIALPNQIKLRTIPLNHPGGCIGYRYQKGQKSLCYVTDHEQKDYQNNDVLVDFCHGSNLLIFDASYVDQDYQERQGWGHSTWEDGVTIAQQANVKALGLYHLDPRYCDQQADQIESQARKVFPKAFIAKEGQTIIL